MSIVGFNRKTVSKLQAAVSAVPDTLHAAGVQVLATPAKTGKLVFDGYKRLGVEAYNWWTCVDCESTFPEYDEDQATHHRRNFGPGIYCNGQIITTCPYCTPTPTPTRSQGLDAKQVYGFRGNETPLPPMAAAISRPIERIVTIETEDNGK